MNITIKKIKHYLKKILYFIITITIVTNAMSLYRSQSLGSASLEMHSFKLIDNNTYSLDGKKPILIHFWATWCPICKLEAANINFLNRYYQIITIAVKSGSDYEIKKYLDRYDYHFKVVNDRDGSLSRKFKIAAYPTTFIYDPKQQLCSNEVGYTSTFGLWLRLLWADL